MAAPLEGRGQATPSPRKLFAEQLATIERLTLQFFGVVLLLVLISAVAAAITSWSLAIFFQVIGMLLALSLAAAAAGGFLGFLFGIPRLLQRSPSASMPAPAQASSTGSGAGTPSTGAAATAQSAAVSSRLYGSNTNLEDISDWVTKIIVGLGLVQAKTIYSKLWDAATNFKTAIPGVVGTDVLFLLVCIAAAVGGFLFFYLETRTRIVLLFADVENAAEVPDHAHAAAASAVNEAPILNLSPPVETDARLPRVAPASKEDPKFLNLTIDKLKDANEFSAWASAQARAGNLQAANTALQQAITLMPQDKDLLIKLAETQALQGRWNDAARTLAEAEQERKDDPELLKRELFVSLYLQSPNSFNRAIPIAEKLIADPKTKDDPDVYLWLAAAQGQRAGYYKDHFPKQYEDARDAALKAVDKLVKLEPDRASPYRKVLRGMLDPSRESTPAEDNDLEVFKGVREFESLIFGS
ncbi:tetratricopeptide repeat protein [Bradyrhizobium sp. DN5]|uniref:tetratricopeptide repeat protein n=1 Tax=Bradyrhizobium sp. DN5 TaxID=3056950 RepID=UPI0035252189